MKAIIILILCLLFTTLNCTSSDIAKCILSNKKTISIVANVISLLKEKNWTNFPSVLLSNYKEFKPIVVQCFEEDEEREKEKEDDNKREERCLKECGDLSDYHERESCWQDCYHKYD